MVARSKGKYPPRSLCDGRSNADLLVYYRMLYLRPAKSQVRCVSKRVLLFLFQDVSRAGKRILLSSLLLNNQGPAIFFRREKADSDILTR